MSGPRSPSEDGAFCSYNVEPDPLAERVECGNTAAYMFSKTVKIGRRSFRQLHPRCRRHASQAVVDLAEDQGYTVEEIQYAS